MVKYVCRGCVYFKECGDSMRTKRCDGRMTKTERKRWENKMPPEKHYEWEDDENALPFN